MGLPAVVVQRAADVDELHDRVAHVAASLARAYAELVRLTRDLLEGELWAGAGIRSPEHWLIVYAGLSPARAREVVALARRSDELPETVAALSAGRLGIDQAAVVARFVPAAYSVQASELAELATVPQLRRALSRYDFAEPASDPVRPAAEVSPGPPSGADPDPDAERASLTMSRWGGRFQLTYRAPASLGALVEQAIREATEALFTGGLTDATLADGLVEVANRALTGIEGTARATKFRTYVHLDTDGGWIGRGGALPRHMLDRLTCDGVLQPVWRTEGRPVDVGRAQRIVPDRTRRLVESRDQGCRFPGCQATGHASRPLARWRSHRSRRPGAALPLAPRPPPRGRLHHLGRPESPRRVGLPSPRAPADPPRRARPHRRGPSRAVARRLPVRRHGHVERPVPAVSAGRGVQSGRRHRAGSNRPDAPARRHPLARPDRRAVVRAPPEHRAQSGRAHRWAVRGRPSGPAGHAGARAVTGAGPPPRQPAPSPSTQPMPR